MYSLMSMRTIARSSSNMNSASARASSVFPTPVGPRKMNEPIGRPGSERPGAGAAQGVGDGARPPSSWPTTPLVQALLHVEQLLDLALQQAADGDAGPGGDHLGHVLLVDLLLQHPAALLLLGQLVVGGLERPLQLGQGAEAQPRRALEVGLALGALQLLARGLDLALDVADALAIVAFSCSQWARIASASSRSAASSSAIASRRAAERRVGLGLQRLLLDLELHDPPLHDVELGRHRVDLDAQAARGLVDQVDRLVGQEARGDVAVREPRRGHQGAVLDAHAVVDLVALLQAAQDRDRWPRPRARPPSPAGSAARAPRPSRRACGTRRASSRPRRAARRGPASASAGWRRPPRPRPRRRRRSCGARR